jgi:hypothetical protein
MKLKFVNLKLLLRRKEKKLKLQQLRSLDWSRKQLSMKDKELLKRKQQLRQSKPPD